MKRKKRRGKVERKREKCGRGDDREGGRKGERWCRQDRTHRPVRKVRKGSHPSS